KGSEVKAAQGSKARAYASRVFVTDAKCDEQDPWLQQAPLVPRILASPKPTAFQHYLVQTNPNVARTLYHYGSRTTETVIRGHKFYWHQGRGESFSAEQWQTAISEEKEKLDELPQDDTQHTQFKPVKPGTRFTFRVYFENLSEIELGALCWILHPFGDENQEYCHSLGMGKPFGMGASKLEAKLYVSDRSKRYNQLFGQSGDWHTGYDVGVSLTSRETLKKLIQPFEKHLIDALKPDRPCQHLYDLRRVSMLLKMLEWPGYRAVMPEAGGKLMLTTATGQTRPNTRYMMIRLPVGGNKYENEYKNRPVLPDPSAFGGLIGAEAKATSDDKDAPASSTPPAPKPVAPKPPKQKSSPQQSTKPKGSKPKSQQRQSSQPKQTGAAQPSPLSSPAPVGFSGTKKEWVTLVKPMSGGKAKIKTDQGEEIVCESITSLNSLQAGQKLRANVTYDKGKAVKAVFKGWK
ncbi:MAG: TIGR03986 family CRISPR-associated RAMP protein, partial [candidate division KSB1 bacterium]|nr:TIGR03986 family CRISPR-associated RAMP protein [candidate division KSB1 bacterium]